MKVAIIVGVSLLILLVIAWAIGNAEHKRIENLSADDRAKHYKKIASEKRLSDASKAHRKKLKNTKMAEKEKLEFEKRDAAKIEKDLASKRKSFNKEFNEQHSTKIRNARVELVRATKEYDATLRQAKKTYSRLEQSLEQRSSEGRRAIREADVHGRNKLAEFSGIDGKLILHEHTLTIKGNTYAITPDIRAEVSRTGEFTSRDRSTVTRIAAGGLLFGPAGAIAGGMVKKNKTNDLREIYILVESEEFAAVITCSPNSGMEAQQIVAEINNAGKIVISKTNERPAIMARARKDMRIIDDEIKRELEESSLRVQSAKEDRNRVDEAEFAVLLIDEEREQYAASKMIDEERDRLSKWEAL